MQEKKMEKKTVIAIAAGVIAVIGIIIAIILLINSKKLSAMVIRIIRQDGQVVLTDEQNREMSILENMKLYTGNTLETGDDGIVDLSLDDTKYLSIENNSQVGFEKSGKALNLNLNKGSLFFNVSEKLEEDETMDITTSTMVVGIRGTSAYVSADSRDIYVGDGTLHVKGINPETGDVVETDLSGFQRAHVYLFDEENKQDGKTVSFEIKSFTVDEMPYTMLRNIVTNPDLFERVVEENEIEPEEILQKAIEEGIEVDDMVLSESNASILEELLLEEDEVVVEEQEEIEEEVEEEEEEEEEEESVIRVVEQQEEQDDQEEVVEEETEEETEETTTQTTYSGSSSGGSSSSGSSSSSSSTSTTTEETTEEETTEETTEEETTEETTEEETTEYTVTIGTATGGSASASATSATAGTTITLTATADDGYEFSEWTVTEGGVTITDNSFTMPESNVSITPSFTELPTYTLYTSTAINEDTFDEATVSVSGGIENSESGGYDVYAGSTVTVTASINEGAYGYSFDSWDTGDTSIDGLDTTTESTSFTMPESDVSLTANYAEITSYNVTIEYPDTITLLDSLEETVSSGSSVTISEDPDDGTIKGKFYVMSNVDNSIATITGTGDGGTTVEYTDEKVIITPLANTTDITVTLEVTFQQ